MREVLPVDEAHKGLNNEIQSLPLVAGQSG